MNKLNQNIILLVLVAIIIAIPIVIYSGFGEEKSYFDSSDDLAKDVLEDTGYKPWYSPFYEPPSPAIESLLFTIQAAIGTLILGFIFGYWRAQKKYKK